jgi:GH25 family lysozyme M1 (1,4-beta-N-acetylmuramidase)
MPAAPSIPVDFEVRLTVLANLRQGAPSRAAPVAHKLEAGTLIRVSAIVVGDTVEGNAHWYRIDPDGFVWAGACSPPLTGPAVPPVAGPTGRTVPIVVDLYHFDRVTSFTTARNAGVLGIIHKATTGDGGRDDAYRDRRDQALAAGLLWGAYHWGTNKPAVAQVRNFLDWAKPDAKTLVALDFERDAASQMTLQRAREFLTEMANRLGRKPVLYSGATVKGALGATKDEFFGTHRLWLAQYSSAASVQASWSNYWLWQYTDGTHGPGPRSAPGLPGNADGQLDCNHFAGSAEELAADWAS